MTLLLLLAPEITLITVGSVLFLVGLSNKAASRRLAPWLAVLSLIAVFVYQLFQINRHDAHTQHDGDGAGTLRLAAFAQYIKLITAGIGILLTLLAWPTNEDATGNGSLHFGADAGEFFALMLMSISGLLLVAGANDIMLLFLGIELASIPTYIMVSLSRPLPVAQEAGVKYFFLGAFAAAIMLFGFSYLYGTTGSTNLYEIMLKLHPSHNWSARIVLTPWQTLAVVMLVAGFAFKMAAVPLHFYAGDVYQGAATPVTAFLSFVPKASGFVALIKVMFALSGPSWTMPEPLVRPNGTGILWILAILTMSVGNVLGLLQYNVKRVLAYSSIAHTGYMLVALAALGSAQFVNMRDPDKANGLEAVLFYLAAYGIMNIGAFGVLQLLPSRDGKGSAETFEDLAGTGRKHVGLGLAMAVCCFSLIGIPLTVGFMGKLMIIKPALAAAAASAKPGAVPVRGAMTWLIIITMINAAVSAAYYLKIVATMFLRTEDSGQPAARAPLAVFAKPALPILLAVVISVVATLLLGSVPPATESLGSAVVTATVIEGSLPDGTPIVPPKVAVGR